MQYKLSNFPIVKIPAVLYSLELYFEPDDKDIKSLENALTYAQKNNPHISWFVAVSNTESDSAIKYNERNGKRGRPKTIVIGKKVKKHFHTGIIGNENKSAYTVAKKVGNTMNKRTGKKVTKVVAMKGLGFIPYSFKQADTFHTGGDFDFDKCKNGLFIEVE